MRSLKIIEDDNGETDAVNQYQIRTEREWNKRYDGSIHSSYR